MKEPQQYDVVVVGSGPAGLSAAVNVANRRRTVAVFTGQSPLGRIGKAHAVSNYLGFASVERRGADRGVPAPPARSSTCR